MSQGWGFLFPRSEVEWLVHQRAFAGWAFPLSMFAWSLQWAIEMASRGHAPLWVDIVVWPGLLLALWWGFTPIARASVASTARWQGRPIEELARGIGIRWATGLAGEEPWWTRWSVGACWLAAPLWFLAWVAPLLVHSVDEDVAPVAMRVMPAALPVAWLVAAAALAGLMRRPEDETRRNLETRNP